MKPHFAGALRAWLHEFPQGGQVGACEAAARAVGPNPWDVVRIAGALARAEPGQVENDTGVTADLRPCAPASPRAVAIVRAGGHAPLAEREGRRRSGAFDTPPEMARRLVINTLAAVRGAARRGLDPACGTGTFLVALAEAGLPDIAGIELDPAAAAVARVAVPRARVTVGDGLVEAGEADLVVGNPPFVSPERQDKALRQRLRERLPWLDRRFDLAVPFAAISAERVRSGGGLGLVLPAPLLVQPYGRVLRRHWLETHAITVLSEPLAFPGAAVKVVLVVLRVGGPPLALPDHGLDPQELLALDQAPLDPMMRPGDGAIVRQVRAASLPLGDLCEVDTGVVSHGPGGGKARLLHDQPGPERVPYVDARDLKEGRVRWLSYQPALMHRAKRPGLFNSPKLLVQRLRGTGPIHAWLDHTGLFAGHTLTVVRPLDDRVPIDRLLALLLLDAVDGLLRIERGQRLDLYPVDVRSVPVPRTWLSDPSQDPIRAWGLDERQAARLSEVARGD